MGNIFETEKPKVKKESKIDVNKIIENTGNNTLGMAYNMQSQAKAKNDNDKAKVVEVIVPANENDMTNLMQAQFMVGGDDSSDVIFIDDGMTLFNILENNKKEKTLFSVLKQR